MPTLMQILTDHGAMLLCGASALLFAGTMIALALRSPLHRQRICEMTLLATLAWLILALLPLPRVQWKTAPVLSNAEFSIAPSVSAPSLEIPPEIIAKPKPDITAKSNVPIIPNLPIPTRQSIDWPMLLVRSYLTGVAIAITWLVLGHILLWRMIRQSTAAPPNVKQMIASQSPRAQNSIRILISKTLARPVTCGVLRPTILLPQSLLQDDCKPQLRQALLHETGHVQQRDAWGNLLFSLAFPLLYFHPLYWLLRRFSNLARELVVDDLAARADGKETYIAQLIELARTRAIASFSPVGTIGILQIRSHFSGECTCSSNDANRSPPAAQPSADC